MSNRSIPRSSMSRGLGRNLRSRPLSGLMRESVRPHTSEDQFSGTKPGRMPTPNKYSMGCLDQTSINVIAPDAFGSEKSTFRWDDERWIRSTDFHANSLRLSIYVIAPAGRPPVAFRHDLTRDFSGTPIALDESADGCFSFLLALLVEVDLTCGRMSVFASSV